MANRIVDLTTRTLGLEVRPEAIATVQGTPEQAYIPFLKTSADDERGWRKTESAPRLRLEQLDSITRRRGIPRFPNLRAVDAIVNPRTQIIYKVASPWAAGAPRIAPFPNAAEEERQLRNLGERFVALPEVEPAVDFYNALKQVEERAPVAPQAAKQVIAYLVTHHTRKYSPRNVWIIQTRGIEIEPEGYGGGLGGSIPIDALNHMRHIIDATTGEWLYSDTAPQPV
jgi:hypothetical protein